MNKNSYNHVADPSDGKYKSSMITEISPDTIVQFETLPGEP